MSLDALQIADNYSKFCNLLFPHISPSLQDYLTNSDLKVAPASSRESHHSAYPGGLVEHSLGVLKYLNKFVSLFPGRYTQEQIIRTALLHDLCKVNCYKQEPGRAKVPGERKWVDVMRYVFSDPFPAGHGSKSVIVALQHGTILTEPEILAILHHMGAYELSGMYLKSYQEACKREPLVLLTGWADMSEATFEPILRGETNGY